MSPGSTGVSFISAFSFTGAAGQWERVFDFGNGPDSGNFLLAREGTSNNLKLFTNIGRGAAMAELTLAGFIQQNQIVVSVATYVSMPSQFVLLLIFIMLYQVLRVGLQRYHALVGQRPFGWRIKSPSRLSPNRAFRKHLHRP